MAGWPESIGIWTQQLVVAKSDGALPMPAPPTGPTRLGCLPQAQIGAGAGRHGCSRQGSIEGMASGICPYPSPTSILMDQHSLSTSPVSGELYWGHSSDQDGPSAVLPGLSPQTGKAQSGQGWDRGAQKSLVLHILRAEPKPSKKASQGNTALSGHFDHSGERWGRKQGSQARERRGLHIGQGVKQRERRWRPKLGSWTPLTSSTSSCDTPCCWGDRESGHLSQR